MSAAVTAIAAGWTVLPGAYDGIEVAADATVLVQGRQILDVVRGPNTVSADRHLELPNGIAFPGFVNLHNHALNGPIFRGIVDDLPTETSADSLVYSTLMPLGDHCAAVLSGDELQAIYRLSMIELLRSGTTTVLDMPRVAHAPALFAAARELGIRVVGAPYIFSTPTRGLDPSGRPDYQPIDEARSLAEALRIVEEYDEGPGGLVRAGLGPHATDTCSPELLRRIGEEARERGLVATVHAAQSRAEVDRVRERDGMTPFELLRETGLLGTNVVTAHCVHATDGDLDILRDSGTTVAHCPLTFARSGTTVSFDRFHRHGVRTGIGTDAYCFDHFAELRAAGFIAKLTSGESGAADARTLLHAGTGVAGGVVEPGLGTLAPGAPADLVVADLGGAHVQPVRDPLKNLVWNATPSDITLVMVGGNIVLADGRLTGCDERSAVTAAATAVERLWESAERAGVLAGRR